MKYYYRTRDRPQLPFKSTIPEERREQLINTIKKVIAVMLVFTVIILAACSVDLSPVNAAEIGNSVNLDGYGERLKSATASIWMATENISPTMNSENWCPTADTSPKENMLRNFPTIPSVQATIQDLPDVTIPTDIKSPSDERWLANMSENRRS